MTVLALGEPQTLQAEACASVGSGSSQCCLTGEQTYVCAEYGAPHGEEVFVSSISTHLLCTTVWLGSNFEVDSYA